MPTRAAKCSRLPATERVADVRIQARSAPATRSARIGAVSSGARCAANPRVRASAQRAHPGSAGSPLIRPSRWTRSRARAATASMDGPRSETVSSASARAASAASIDAIRFLRLARHRRPLDTLVGPGEGIGRLPGRGIELGRKRADVRRIRRVRLHRRAGVAHELLDLSARDLHAEEPGGDIGDLVRFVDDQRIGEREQLGEPVIPERHVGEQEVVVDHHHVGGGGPAARLGDVAPVEHRTLRSEAVVSRRGDGAAHRVVLGQVRHLGEVAAVGLRRPSRQTHYPRRHARRGGPSRGERLLVAPAAEVVRAALQPGDSRGPFERPAYERQIALDQPVLQMAGARGDHHPAAARDRGNEVGERLAGPGPRLADEGAPVGHGALDGRGHRALLGTGRVAGQQPGQRTGRGEDVIACSRGVQCSRLFTTIGRSFGGKPVKGIRGRIRPRANQSRRPPDRCEPRCEHTSVSRGGEHAKRSAVDVDGGITE